MNIFEEIKNRLMPGEPDPRTQEQRVDESLRPDQPYLIDAASPETDHEFKNNLITPTKVNGNYHDMLIKEIQLANLSGEEDEDYFSVSMQLILMEDEMGLTDLRDQDHAWFMAELGLTDARKGMMIQLVGQQNTVLKKHVTETKNGQVWQQ